MEEIYERKEIY